MIIQFVGHILNKKRSKMITKKHTKGGGDISLLCISSHLKTQLKITVTEKKSNGDI